MRNNLHIGDVKSARKMISNLLSCETSQIEINALNNGWFAVYRKTEVNRYFLQRIQIIKDNK